MLRQHQPKRLNICVRWAQHRSNPGSTQVKWCNVGSTQPNMGSNQGRLRLNMAQLMPLIVMCPKIEMHNSNINQPTQTKCEEAQHRYVMFVILTHQILCAKAMPTRCICEILTLSPSCPCWVDSGFQVSYFSAGATSGGCCIFQGLPQGAMLDPKGCLGACVFESVLGHVKASSHRNSSKHTRFRSAGPKKACNMSKLCGVSWSVAHKKRI